MLKAFLQMGHYSGVLFPYVVSKIPYPGSNEFSQQYPHWKKYQHQQGKFPLKIAKVYESCQELDQRTQKHRNNGSKCRGNGSHIFLETVDYVSGMTMRR